MNEINRLVIISEKGKILELIDVSIKEEIQDDGQTLKIFTKKND